MNQVMTQVMTQVNTTIEIFDELNEILDNEDIFKKVEQQLQQQEKQQQEKEEQQVKKKQKIENGQVNIDSTTATTQDKVIISEPYSSTKEICN